LEIRDFDLYGIFARWENGVIYNALAVGDAAPGDGPDDRKRREMIGFLRRWNRSGVRGIGNLLSPSPPV
jgi:hypothetical protein